MSDFFTTSINDVLLYMSGAVSLLFASFTSLFSVANPTAVMPLFISLTESYSDEERRSTARWTSIYMFLILIVFLLSGTIILSFFGISIAGIRIAGGLIIMRAAYSMLNPDKTGRKLTEEDEIDARNKNDISFSPLAMPMLSGPGSIAVVIGFASQATTMADYIIHGVSISLVVLIAYGVLRLSPMILRHMGTIGMNIMTRMMGFIALAISVQFILSGISLFFSL